MPTCGARGMKSVGRRCVRSANDPDMRVTSHRIALLCSSSSAVDRASRTLAAMAADATVRQMAAFDYTVAFAAMSLLVGNRVLLGIYIYIYIYIWAHDEHHQERVLPSRQFSSFVYFMLFSGAKISTVQLPTTHDAPSRGNSRRRPQFRFG